MISKTKQNNMQSRIGITTFRKCDDETGFRRAVGRLAGWLACLLAAERSVIGVLAASTVNGLIRLFIDFFIFLCPPCFADFILFTFQVDGFINGMSKIID
jgi:hypothetical protein